MRNDRLRDAVTALGMKVNDLGPQVGVNIKTAQRWFYEGRTPRRKTADRVAQVLGVPVDWLWPHIDGETNQAPTDLVRMYQNRLAAPRQLWLQLIRDARNDDAIRIGVSDDPALQDVVRATNVPHDIPEKVRKHRHDCACLGRL